MLVGLQTEKEVLLRSVKEQEAEISTLRQAAQLHQAALVQERDRSQREMATLQNQMQAKVRNLNKTQQRTMKEEPINVYPKCLKPNICFIVFPRSQTQYCVFLL